MTETATDIANDLTRELKGANWDEPLWSYHKYLTDLTDRIKAVSGGSVAGAARVLGPFPFAFDDAGLEDGIAFYTPTIGDILLDAWVEISEAFDGTTPMADIGYANNVVGLFSYNIGMPPGPIDLSQADSESVGSGYLFNGDGAPSLMQSSLLALSGTYETDAISATPAAAAPWKLRVTQSAFAKTPRMGQGRFTAATPLEIWASQDGTAGGDPIGGAQGAGAVYLVVATPSLT